MWTFTSFVPKQIYFAVQISKMFDCCVFSVVQDGDQKGFFLFDFGKKHDSMEIKI